jgi:hypothetical protein
MDRRRWKLWVAGIAFVQLLVIGADVALLWPPPPSEAERMAAHIRVGMPHDQVRRVLAWYKTFDTPEVGGRWGTWCRFEDGSSLYVGVPGGLWPRDTTLTVNSVCTEPPPYIHPLTRLRRPLARVLPFLGE